MSMLMIIQYLFAKFTQPVKIDSISRESRGEILTEFINIR